MTKHPIKVVVPVRNAEKWIGKCLQTIAMQKLCDFDVCVVDDDSDDYTANIAVEICEKYGWQFIERATRKYTLANYVLGVTAHCPKDEDVIINIDGDDWLPHDLVFARVLAEYDQGNLVTYGSLQVYHNGKVHDKDMYNGKQAPGRDYRNHPWHYSCLRTMKYRVWKEVRDADLRDPDTGEYYTAACDVAQMMPALELAGHHVAYIRDKIYIYNRDNTQRVASEQPRKQMANLAKLRELEPYKPIDPDTDEEEVAIL